MCKSVTAVALLCGGIYYDLHIENIEEIKMKNTMFQFATNREIFSDTGLLTANESFRLFESNRDKFIRELELGRNPEMCIWIDCDTDSSYGETSLHWIADDFQVIDGELWQRV